MRFSGKRARVARYLSAPQGCLWYRWRTGKSVRTVPAEMAAHKSANAKGSYRVNNHQSALILEGTKILIPVGSRELFSFYQLQIAYNVLNV